MNIKSKLFLLSLVISIFVSCEKDSIIKNNGLIGKWRLTETFNGYTNGGSFTWMPVPANTSEMLEFTNDRKYYKNVSFTGGGNNCTGTYLLQADSTIQINSSCQTTAEYFKMLEVSPQYLQLRMNVREGYILYKYESE